MLAQGVEKFGFDPKLLHLGAGLVVLTAKFAMV